MNIIEYRKAVLEEFIGRKQEVLENILQDLIRVKHRRKELIGQDRNTFFWGIKTLEKEIELLKEHNKFLEGQIKLLENEKDKTDD